MKKFFMAMMLFCLVSALAAMPVMAGGRGMCRYDSYENMSLEDKFMDKASFIMMNKDELGITGEQEKTIKDLKTELKRTLIKKQAEIDLLALEIKSGLWEDTIDTAALSKLIAQKYELKKDKTIAIVEAYANLKKTLTKEQMDSMKKLWHEQKKQMACGMMGGMKGHMMGEKGKK